MEASKRRKPVPHHGKPAPKKQPAQYTVIREVIAIAVVGLLLAVVVTDAVVGMSGQFGPTPDAVFMTAGGGGHE